LLLVVVVVVVLSSDFCVASTIWTN